MFAYIAASWHFVRILRPLFLFFIHPIVLSHLHQKYYAKKNASQPKPEHQRSGSFSYGHNSLKKQKSEEANFEYIVRSSEVLNDRYIVDKIIGKGSFGRVVKAFDRHSKEFVAIKIVRNQVAFFRQAQMEINILKLLQSHDTEKWNVVRMLDSFMHQNHQCIVFELLSMNLYELLQNTRFHGVSLRLIRKFVKQLLYTLHFLSNIQGPPDSVVSVIHCDLKPENILLVNAKKSAIKVIDFGSACFYNHKMYMYIQSRFYRAPEILLGIRYTAAIEYTSSLL